jgi:membrane protein DedA with SNARE-associated domain
LLSHLVDVLVAFGPLGILVLALIDSAVPVAGVFDVLIAVFAAQRPAVGWWCAVCAVIGSTIGNYVLFETARRGGRRYLDQSAGSPRGKKFRAWFERYGLITVFIPALLPIPLPLKLFVISAGALGTGTRAFLIVVILARTLRYSGDAWMGVNLGKGSAGFLKAHVWHFLAAAVVLFVVLYFAVRLSDRWRGRLQDKGGIGL